MSKKKILFFEKPSNKNEKELTPEKYYKMVDLNEIVQEKDEFVVACKFYNTKGHYYQYLSELICPDIMNIIVSESTMTDDLKSYILENSKDTAINAIIKESNIVYDKNQNVYALVVGVTNIFKRLVNKQTPTLKEPKNIITKQIIFSNPITFEKKKRKRSSDYDVLYTNLHHALSNKQKNTKQVLNSWFIFLYKFSYSKYIVYT